MANSDSRLRWPTRIADSDSRPRSLRLKPASGSESSKTALAECAADASSARPGLCPDTTARPVVDGYRIPADSLPVSASRRLPRPPPPHRLAHLIQLDSPSQPHWGDKAGSAHAAKAPVIYIYIYIYRERESSPFTPSRRLPAHQGGRLVCGLGW